MSLAQLNYCCMYVSANKGKEVDLGDGMVYKLRFHRNTKKDKIENNFNSQASKRIGYWAN